MNDGSWDQLIQEVIDNTSEDGPYHPYSDYSLSIHIQNRDSDDDGHLQFIDNDDEAVAELYREDNRDGK